MQRLTVGGVWADMSAIVTRHFVVFATLMAAFAFLPSLFVSRALPDVFSIHRAAAGAMPAVHPGFAPTLLVLVALQFMGMFAIIAIAADPHEGGGASVGRTLATSLPALGRFLAAGALVWLALVAVATLIGVVSGMVLGFGGTPSAAGEQTLAAIVVLVTMVIALWAGARLTPLPAVLLREGIGPIDGLRRAWALSRGATLALIQLSFVYLGVALVLALMAQGLVAAFGIVGAAAGGLRFGSLIANIVSAAASAWLCIYYGAALGVVYRHLAER